MLQQFIQPTLYNTSLNKYRGFKTSLYLVCIKKVHKVLIKIKKLRGIWIEHPVHH